MQQKGIASDYTCPDWYGHMQVSKYLGVAPWELLAQSVWWRDKGLVAMSAEHEASEKLKHQPST